MNPKDIAQSVVDREAPALVDLSHKIHAHPELAFAEVRAAEWICEILGAAGFSVTRGICSLPTAFEATAGSGELSIAICAEYDALPVVGHACGHNIIAAAAVGAGLALAAVANDLGLTVRVIGTPAEEGAAGRFYCWSAGPSIRSTPL